MRYVSLKAPVKFIKLYHSYENAAIMVCTSVIVSFLLKYSQICKLDYSNMQIRLFDYFTV